MQPQEENQQDEREEEAKFVVLYTKLTLGGLIAICLLVFQAFISTTPDIASYISLGAIAIAIPLLAGMFIMASFEEAGVIKFTIAGGCVRAIPSLLGTISTIVGLDAAFWHAHWILGIGFLASSLITYIIVFTIFALSKTR